MRKTPNDKRLIHAAAAKLAALLALMALIAFVAVKLGVADEAMLELGMTTVPLSRAAVAELASAPWQWERGSADRREQGRAL